jgi:hypothetical protein
MPSYNPGVILTDMDVYKRSDVRVRIQVAVPQDGIFTLGVSTLNGSDVLGSAFQWDIYEDELVEVSQTAQIDVTSGISTRPLEQVATITAQTAELDPNLNADIHPNTKIKLEYQTSDMGPTEWTGLITGYITEVSSSYNYQGKSLVTIQVEDIMRRFMNAPLNTYTITAGTSILDAVDALITAGIAAGGLDDTIYTPTFDKTLMYSVGFTGAKTYTNTNVGAVLNDLVDAELGMLYLDGEAFQWQERDIQFLTGYQGYTKKFDSWTIGYSPEYLFSQINASIYTAPATVYSKNNTDVSSFFGAIIQNFEVNLQNADQLDQWMTSVTQFSPGLRVSNFSTPFFVPAKLSDLIYIIDDFNGKTEGIYQKFVSREIYIDPTSVSTQMQLFQPV